jgi:AraC family transcriptional regulator of adaptative response / DNA-3-methyladenine glycosylase II
MAGVGAYPEPVHEDVERCYRVVQSKDPRFDGWFVTAVLTTGIYCRPSCPARSPLARNVRFLPTAAAAQRAGFRACKRCRPDASPGSPEWNVRRDLVGRAMRLIADGTVDRVGVPGLASLLGYSVRQIERHLVAEVGAGPLALARTQRAQTARLLIETTALPFAEVAFTSGFASIRQFNDTVHSVFDATPTALRTRSGDHRDPAASGALTFRLPFRRPFAPDSLFGHLAAAAVPGCEEVRGGTYRRTLRLPRGSGVVGLRPTPDHVLCQLALADLRDLPTAIARCRRLLDLDADPQAAAEVLSGDEHLRAAVAKEPGRRIPGAVDEHELAVRAVLGQQISTAAARTLGARLVARHGVPVDDPGGGLTHLFPTVDELESVDPGTLGLPVARQRCVAALVGALASGSVELGVESDWDRARVQLRALPGVGRWTAELIAMRALGDPDAFPAPDAGVRKGAAALGLPRTGAALAAHSERWRPWRSYAVQYLWAATDHPILQRPPKGAP